MTSYTKCLLFVKDSKEYEKKMVWLEGLSNIQLGRVVEFLEPIASGNSAESRHLRVLAAWASLPTAPLRPDVVSVTIDKSVHLLKSMLHFFNETCFFRYIPFIGLF